MGVGKYSPTVSAAYFKDQNWHRKLRDVDDWYDIDGYDSYGYNKDDIDRAGYSESEYLTTYSVIDDDITYTLAEDVWYNWTFDGTRPVRRK